MQKVKLTVDRRTTPNDGGYTEISQSQTTKQALARRMGEHHFERITGYVKCRDFLVDSYAFAKANKDFGIYGFSFPGSKIQPDWTGAYLVHLFSGKEEKNNFLQNIGYIHAIEHANGLPQTVIYEASDTELVTVGDKRWLHNSLTLSLYTFLLRMACYKDYSTSKEPNVGEWIMNFGKQQFSDSKYAASVAVKTWDMVLGNLKLLETKEFCGFEPGKVSVGTIHHNSGFISVFGWHTEINPKTAKSGEHWKIMAERGLEMHPKTKAA